MYVWLLSVSMCSDEVFREFCIVINFSLLVIIYILSNDSRIYVVKIVVIQLL